MKKSEIRAMVDRLAEIRIQSKNLADEESDIRAALLTLEKQVIEGDEFTAVLKLVTTNRLDTAGVKKEMGDTWYKAHSVASNATRIETIRKVA